MATHHINELYQRLPNLFAKEVARRQKDAIPLPPMSGVKRGPEPSAEDNAMRKRLDTGERRTSNPPISSASPPHARSPSVMSNGPSGPAPNMNPALGIPPLNTDVSTIQPASATMGMGMAMAMVQSQGTPSQQSPLRVSPETMPMGTPQGFPGGMDMAQAQRARQQSQLRQIQAVPPKESQRMMPPPMSNGGPSQMGQQPSVPSMPGNPQIIQAVFNAFGQGGVQNYQAILRGPGHPFINYMTNSIPNFMQLGLQQQLQAMSQAQVRMVVEEKYFKDLLVFF